MTRYKTVEAIRVPALQIAWEEAEPQEDGSRHWHTTVEEYCDADGDCTGELHDAQDEPMDNDAKITILMRDGKPCEYCPGHYDGTQAFISL